MTRSVQADARHQHVAHPVAIRFAGTATEIVQPSHLDQERAAGIRKALTHVVAGRPDHGLYELVRSVERQARIEGLGSLEIAPRCPCGGRCPAGSAVRR